MGRRLAKVGIALLLLPVMMIAGAVFWANVVFPHLRPKWALEHLFTEPGAAVVVKSEQHGFFYPKNFYSAKAVVRGETLQLQSYLKPTEEDLQEAFDPFNACEDFVKAHPDSQLFTGNLAEPHFFTDGTYVAHHPPSHSYCFTYHRF